MNTSKPLDFSTERAIRLWTRRQSGTWSERDEAELQEWLASGPDRRVAYERVAHTWTTAGKIDPNRHDLPAPVRNFPARRLVAVCAALLGVALLVPAWRYADNWWSGVPVRWVTARGEPKRLVLADGTRVLLDADSELVVKLGARVRRVSLERGEALFTVVHDASRPFEVQVGRGRITDLGTRFDVETLRGSARVAVFEGRVGVATRHGEVVVSAGHGGGYDEGGMLLPTIKVDESTTRWSEGQRHFDDEPLSDVVERLTRYHAVTFVFADPELRKLRVSGTFRTTDLALFLRTLSAALPIEARWIGPRRVEFTPRTVSRIGHPAERVDTSDRP